MENPVTESKKVRKESKRKGKTEKRRSSSKSDGQSSRNDSKSKGKKRSRSESKDKRSSKKAKREETVTTETPAQMKEVPKTKAPPAEETKQASKTKKSSKTKKTQTPVTSNGVKSFLSDNESLISKFRETHDITVHGDVTNFAPLENFAQTGFSQELLKTTSKFPHPTPIQAQTWPILLSKRDVIGIAETGSGKTLSFGLPGLAHVIHQKEGKQVRKPLMLVLAPTRELAQQCHDVLEEVGNNCNPKIGTAVVYGGVSRDRHIRLLRGGQVNVLVACPGRLMDLMNEGACDLSSVSYVVLDEADRMLDMGFEPSIRAILQEVPKERQTVMFSATWPKSVKTLASAYLNNPIRVVVGSEKLTANSRVEQIVEVIDMNKRDDRLLQLLKQYHQDGTKVLVFALYKKEAARLEVLLRRKGYDCCSIHGDKSSPERAKALDGFKEGKPPLMIATDVAARGLHIPKVEYVINYSFPLTVEDYVHRIGRTGRAGATGIAHTFFHQHDKAHSGKLISVLRAANTPVPEELLAFGTATKKQEPKLGKIDTNYVSNRITFDSDDDDDL